MRVELDAGERLGVRMGQVEARDQDTAGGCVEPGERIGQRAELGHRGAQPRGEAELALVVGREHSDRPVVRCDQAADGPGIVDAPGRPEEHQVDSEYQPGTEDGEPRTAVVRELQYDPVRDTLIHIDFQAVRMDEQITVEVPIHVVGEAAGVREQSGVLAVLMRTVEVSCLPSQIPDRLDVDVSTLRIHDVVTVADLRLPEGVRVTTPSAQPVATVAPPMAEEVVAAAAAPAAEPEVVTERKPKEEEEPKGKEGREAKEEGKGKK